MMSIRGAQEWGSGYFRDDKPSKGGNPVAESGMHGKNRPVPQLASGIIRQEPQNPRDHPDRRLRSFSEAM
jgi:hypothetical protein